MIKIKLQYPLLLPSNYVFDIGVCTYLNKIERKCWVNYMMLESGMATYDEITSDTIEQRNS